MPLFDDTPSKAPDVTETITAPDSATVYDTKPEVKTAITLEGDPWTTKAYYSQVLGKDDTTRRLDLGLSPTLQQYVRINNFVILQTTELGANTDENIITVVAGEGTIYPSVVPNVSDHFVAAMSDGRMGLFIVKAVNRIKYYSYTAWNIAYELVDYHNEVYQRNLDAKTIDTWTYDPENPLVPLKGGNQSQDRYDITRKLKELCSWWYDEFYDLRTQTGIHPGYQRLYDGNLIEFMNTVIPTKLKQFQPDLRVYATPTGEHKRTFRTIWNVIVDGETTGLRRIYRHSKVASTKGFGSSYIYTTIALADMGGVVFPSKEPTLVKLSAMDETQTAYVFSEAFYDDDKTNMTMLEKIVVQALANESYTTKVVITEIEALYDLPLEIQFYRIPVLLWLLLRQL